MDTCQLLTSLGRFADTVCRIVLEHNVGAPPPISSNAPAAYVSIEINEGLFRFRNKTLHLEGRPNYMYGIMCFFAFLNSWIQVVEGANAPIDNCWQNISQYLMSAAACSQIGPTLIFCNVK